GPGAVALDERDDRVVGHLEAPLGADADLLTGGNGDDRELRHGGFLKQKKRGPCKRGRRPAIAASRSLLDEQEDALLVGDDHVGPPVAGHVLYDHLGTDAGIVVDQVPDPLDLPPAPPELEPVEDGRVVRAYVAVGTVRPEAFAGDDVPEAI